MSLDDKAISSIVELAAPAQFTIADKEYSAKPLHLVAPPMSPFVELTTLQAFVDLIEAGIEGLDKDVVFAHVVNPTVVELTALNADDYGRRQIYARAQVPEGIVPFKFGSWHDPENFTIAVQAGFQRSLVESADGSVIGDTDYVLRIASHVTAELTTLSQDDGISQNVTMKQGVALKAQEQMKSRVQLSPYRTFPEVNQPLSTFVFRIRTQGGEVVHLALFEADGGRWRIDAAKEVANWLTPKIDPIPVVR